MQEFLFVEADERAPQRLRRKALDTADALIATLDGVAKHEAHAIHDARRRLKELRALTSILERGKDERRFFRHAGRLLSNARDTKAILEAFDRLRERFESEWKPRQYQQIRGALKQRTAAPIDASAMEDLRRALIVARGRIAAWAIDQMGRADLWRALARSYRRARREMRRALDERTPEAIHEWRKRVKTHWYHAQFLTEVAVMPADPRLDALQKLSRTLGRHHDLVLLDEICVRSPELLGSSRYVAAFRTFIARELRDLFEDAERAGGVLFGDSARNWIANTRDTAAATRIRIGPKKAPKRARPRASMLA